MGKGNTKTEKAKLKMKNEKSENMAMQKPLPDELMDLAEETAKSAKGEGPVDKDEEKDKASDTPPEDDKPPEGDGKKTKRKKTYDFSQHFGGGPSKCCPWCRKWDTKRHSTKGKVQYRKCLNGSCPGNPHDSQKKSYKVIGKEI
jgi:hypothetical protein